MAPLPSLIDSEIASLTEYFNRTGNVAAAWRVYSLARQHDRPTPGSVLAEIDRFAAGIAEVAYQAMLASPSDTPLYFTPEKLGTLWRGDGGQNPVGALQRDWRDMSIGVEVARQIENGKKVGAAIEAVANALPYLNSETVRKAWQKFQRDGR